MTPCRLDLGRAVLARSPYWQWLHDRVVNKRSPPGVQHANRILYEPRRNGKVLRPYITEQVPSWS